jgi:regulator of sirC expression with transglutaminase-like and TPR domain
MMLLVDSDEIVQFRDRGILRMHLRQFDGAGQYFTHYLKHSPNAGDRQEIEDHLKELKRIRATMN